jgi:hypothetical protein
METAPVTSRCVVGASLILNIPFLKILRSCGALGFFLNVPDLNETNKQIYTQQQINTIDENFKYMKLTNKITIY